MEGRSESSDSTSILTLDEYGQNFPDNSAFDTHAFVAFAFSHSLHASLASLPTPCCPRKFCFQPFSSPQCHPELTPWWKQWRRQLRTLMRQQFYSIGEMPSWGKGLVSHSGYP